jgi:hypothetical protein
MFAGRGSFGSSFWLRTPGLINRGNSLRERARASGDVRSVLAAQRELEVRPGGNFLAENWQKMRKKTDHLCPWPPASPTTEVQQPHDPLAAYTSALMGARHVKTAQCVV